MPNRLLRRHALSALVAVACALGCAASVQAQTVADGAFTIQRTVPLVIPPGVGGGPFGLAVDPNNRNVYFISDNGRDISVLDTSGTITTLVNNAGNFQGPGADLKLSPTDGFLYAAGGANTSEIRRFSTAGVAQPVLATITNGTRNDAYGFDFDFAGNLYISDTTPGIYRVTPAGDVSTFSTGWTDVDDVVLGPDSSFFVHDGGPLNRTTQILRVDHTGASTVYASGLTNASAGAYDWATGDYYYADFQAGRVYRLRDADNNGTIEAGEVSLFASGFGRISALAFGPSSASPGTWSLYVGDFTNRSITEVAGFAPNPGDYGPRVDDDNDGVCELGSDTNADGDCLDTGEQDGAVDCADANPARNPSATEVCDNGLDDDCDGNADLLDTECLAVPDNDGDGYCAIGQDLNDDGDCSDMGEAVGPGDCNDNNDTVYPGATEVCDGLDNNCNLIPDEGVQNTYYLDLDGDTYGTGAPILACAQPADTATVDGDCNDANDAINPAATEVCDLADNNCDAQIDEGVQNTYYLDADGDNFGVDGSVMMACIAPVGYSAQSGDCDDASDVSYPGATEICDELDNDCNLQIDEGLSRAYYGDLDNDGFGDPLLAVLACAQPGDTVDNADDCDDSSDAINPDATEVCDAVDNNCDTQIDEGLTQTYYVDADGDTYGTGAPIEACVQPPDTTTQSGDCNDAEATAFPGNAEVCGNDIDNDCDGRLDNADNDCGGPVFLDGDNDGYCSQGQDLNDDGDCDDDGEQNGQSDCYDEIPEFNSGAAELCTDAFDNNCDGDIDEQDAACGGFVDVDGDGYCAEGVDLNLDGDCADDIEQGLVGDCDESNDEINVAADEVCDGVDNNCDGDADEDLPVSAYLADADGDTYGAGAVIEACQQPAGTVELVLGTPEDCNDGESSINPGAAEVCGDAADNDCDGFTDFADLDAGCGEGDGDGDGYCANGQDFNDDGDCNDDGEDTGAFDCMDENPAINPGATEVCDDLDNDCDGSTDEGLLVAYYADEDGDGFGAGGQLFACALPNDGSLNDGDCEDDNGAINPDAAEVCNNRLDDNCDGDADEDDLACGDFLDVDDDGYCATGRDLNNDGDCSDNGEQNGAADCDEGNAAVFPGATEACTDGLDTDCDGVADTDEAACAALFDLDGDGYCVNGQDLNADGDCFGGNEAGLPGDCDDTTAARAPGLTEVCGDDLDNDCDDVADNDEDACAEQVDGDEDGFCAQGRDENGDGDCFDADEDVDVSDCDDEDEDINPDAEEICGDDADNDCDGRADDEDRGSCGPAVTDNDGDGFCREGVDLNDDGFCTGEDEDTDDRDCDDDDDARNPGADEVCDDGIDNNCDGLYDDQDEAACAIEGDLLDDDGDGYCEGGRDTNNDGDCADGAEVGGEDTDCDDEDEDINPGAREVCDDEVDNDCDGDTDAEEPACAEPDDNNANNTNNNTNNNTPDDDLDDDGVLNEDDNCRGTANPGQEDLDGDGVGAACEVETEGAEVQGSGCATAPGDASRPSAAWLLLALGALVLRRRR
jgi:MYXO-CTERM domain-containing protein